jgi:hypothetical protein
MALLHGMEEGNIGPSILPDVDELCRALRKIIHYAELALSRELS